MCFGKSHNTSNEKKPKFIGKIHKEIISEALKELDPNHPIIIELNKRFKRLILGIVGPIIDDIDRAIKNYNPLDHFDNAYIKEGWELVSKRLSKFKKDNSDIDSLALALHAISDFYSHSTFVHFALKDVASNKVKDIYDPQKPDFGFEVPDYSPSSSFPLNKFTVNDYYWKDQEKEPWEIWKGKLISGRYAQKKDTSCNLIDLATEGLTKIPDSLLKAPDFYLRGSLPHHHEIAVDDKENDHNNVIYQQNYITQFNMRFDCSVRHIKKVFYENWNGE